MSMDVEEIFSRMIKAAQKEDYSREGELGRLVMLLNGKLSAGEKLPEAWQADRKQASFPFEKEDVRSAIETRLETYSINGCDPDDEAVVVEMTNYAYGLAQAAWRKR
jgi:hypothetical protein